MSATAVPYLMLAATAASAYASYESGRATAKNLRAQQLSETIDAQSQEIQRRRNLLNLLAAQNVAAGVSGLTPNEGFQVIQEDDLKWYDLDKRTADVRSQITRASLGAQARSAERVGALKAVSTAATGAYKYSLIK